MTKSPRVIGASSDARWRHVPKGTRRIDMLRAHELELRSRRTKRVAEVLAKKGKA